tara:strand:- start:150 stop:686 length:537 start_codon:yes stop_codon:yes gene_type:complete
MGPKRARKKRRSDEFFTRTKLLYVGYKVRQDKAEAYRLEKEKAIKAKKRPPKSLPPFDKADSFFKREAYALLREYSDSEGRAIIKSVVRIYADEPRYPSYTENRFYWGLVAIDSGEGILSKQKLSKIAKQLLYADHNGIAPQLLIGFLYQIGGSDHIHKQLSKNYRDPSLNLAAAAVS